MRTVAAWEIQQMSSNEMSRALIHSKRTIPIDNNNNRINNSFSLVGHLNVIVGVIVLWHAMLSPNSDGPRKHKSRATLNCTIIKFLAESPRDEERTTLALAEKKYLFNFVFAHSLLPPDPNPGWQQHPPCVCLLCAHLVGTDCVRMLYKSLFCYH